MKPRLPQAGLHGGAAVAAYTTSKHALMGLPRRPAWMYAKRGIRCNAICLGAIRTNIAAPTELADAMVNTVLVQTQP